ncbi:hypothetical protein Tco_0972327 [Tanacetum coccineum]
MDLCFCGHLAVTRTSCTDANPGRRVMIKSIRISFTSVASSNPHNRSFAVVLEKGLFQTIYSCVVSPIRRMEPQPYG